MGGHMYPTFKNQLKIPKKCSKKPLCFWLPKLHNNCNKLTYLALSASGKTLFPEVDPWKPGLCKFHPVNSSQLKLPQVNSGCLKSALGQLQVSL